MAWRYDQRRVHEGSFIRILSAVKCKHGVQGGQNYLMSRPVNTYDKKLSAPKVLPYFLTYTSLPLTRADTPEKVRQSTQPSLEHDKKFPSIFTIVRVHIFHPVAGVAGEIDTVPRAFEHLYGPRSVRHHEQSKICQSSCQALSSTHDGKGTDSDTGRQQM